MNSYLRTLFPLILLLGACASDDNSTNKSEYPEDNLEIFTYNELVTRDLDTMNDIILTKIKESRSKLSQKEIPLRDAFRTLMSRPNKDGMIAKILGPLKNSLEEIGQWEPSIMSLIDESVRVLSRKDKKVKARVQLTYITILENMISEFRPRIDRPGPEKRGIEKIAVSRIIVSREAQNERRLTTMENVVSPSELATLVLQELDSNSEIGGGTQNP
jgi:hypothetical protein